MPYEIFDKLCKDRHVTASQVSKKTGVSTATLSSWKMGRYTPKRDKMQKLADFFGVSLEYLQTGEERSLDKRFTDKISFEAYLNSLGWTVSLTDYAKDMPCEKCGQEIELAEEEKELYPFGKNAPKLCKHCLRDDNHYIISNGSISVNVSYKDFADFEADVRTMCMDRIKEFINESVKTSLAAARPSVTPLSDEDNDLGELAKKN